MIACIKSTLFSTLFSHFCLSLSMNIVIRGIATICDSLRLELCLFVWNYCRTHTHTYIFNLWAVWHKDGDGIPRKKEKTLCVRHLSGTKTKAYFMPLFSYAQFVEVFCICESLHFPASLSFIDRINFASWNPACHCKSSKHLVNLIRLDNKVKA